jgi:hypothetical protein
LLELALNNEYLFPFLSHSHIKYYARNQLTQKS